jgi:hypothetical protein
MVLKFTRTYGVEIDRLARKDALKMEVGEVGLVYEPIPGTLLFLQGTATPLDTSDP